MRKIVCMLICMLVVVSMVVPAYAVTPALKIPDLPKIPEIKVEVKVSESFWDKWFQEHPLNIVKLYGNS